jgi:hypothetical protein
MACFSWSVTGLLHLHDLNVIIPNVLGFLFGVAQVALKLVYSGGNTTEPTFLLTADNESAFKEESEAGYSLATP